MELATVSTIPSSVQSLVRPCGFSSLNLSLQKEKLCAVKGRNPTHRNEKTMANFDFTTQSDTTQLTKRFEGFLRALRFPPSAKLTPSLIQYAGPH